MFFCDVVLICILLIISKIQNEHLEGAHFEILEKQVFTN